MKFSELDDRAKDTVRDACRYDEVDRSYDWWDGVYEQVTEVGALMGIEIGTHSVKLMSGKTRQDPSIRFSGFCSQGDGVCYEGRYYYEKDAPTKVRTHAPEDVELHRIVDTLTALQMDMILRGYRTQAAYISTDSSNYCHSNTMQFQFDEFDGPDNHSDGFTDSQVDFIRLLRDFADWIYKQLEAEHDYLTSDECIDERLAEDDVEYDEDGALA